MEFEILETVDHDDFTQMAKKYLDEGWELHGHLIAFPDSRDEQGVQTIRYIQAFIKRSRTQEPIGYRKIN